MCSSFFLSSFWFDFFFLESGRTFLHHYSLYDNVTDANIVWNKELLWLGGYLAAATYLHEMNALRSLWIGSLPPSSSNALNNGLDLPSPEIQRWLTSQALHILYFFSFRPSTPSPLISTLLEENFFGSFLKANEELVVMSTKGVLGVGGVRVYEEGFREFVRDLATVPPSIQSPSSVALPYSSAPSSSSSSAVPMGTIESLKNPPPLLSSLRNRNLLKPIVLTDVLDEMRGRAFSIDEMVACLKWWFGLGSEVEKDGGVGMAELKGELRRAFLDAAVVCIPASVGSSGISLDKKSVAGTEARGQVQNEDRVLPFSFITTYIPPTLAGSVIPIDNTLPIPPDTLPYSISRLLPTIYPQLLYQYFGWKGLDVSGWLRFYLSTAFRNGVSAESDGGGKGSLEKEKVIGPTAEESTRILNLLSRSWPSLPANERQTIRLLLSEVPIVPTRSGILPPREAYFASVDIFADLPIVELHSAGGARGGMGKVMEGLLEFLGVRKHVELQLIFTR